MLCFAWGLSIKAWDLGSRAFRIRVDNHGYNHHQQFNCRGAGWVYDGLGLHVWSI